MDIFDAISIFGETYVNYKKGCKKDKDHLKVACKTFNESKAKIDKMYEDEINSSNKISEAIWELVD